MDFYSSRRVGARLGFKSLWSMMSLIFLLKIVWKLGGLAEVFVTKIQRMSRDQSVDKSERCEIYSSIQHLLLNDTFPCELLAKSRVANFSYNVLYAI